MLYGRDTDFVPVRRWLRGMRFRGQLRLRSPLRMLVFHDGTPVRAVDCIASHRRWAVRPSFGAAAAESVGLYDRGDDLRFDMQLREPFAQMTLALSEFCFIMPERIAKDRMLASRITEGDW